MPVIAEDRDEFFIKQREVMSFFADKLLGLWVNSLSIPFLIENL
jgi:hypothetical protein